MLCLSRGSVHFIICWTRQHPLIHHIIFVMANSNGASLRAVSEAVGSSSESLVTTSSPSSATGSPPAPVTSVRSAAIHFTVSCPECGGENQVLIPLQAGPVTAFATCASLSPQSVGADHRMRVRPVTDRKREKTVTPAGRKPLRQCDMAGVPIVTPKPATVPRPFRLQTEARAQARMLAKKMFHDDADD